MRRLESSWLSQLPLTQVTTSVRKLPFERRQIPIHDTKCHQIAVAIPNEKVDEGHTWHVKVAAVEVARIMDAALPTLWKVGDYLGTCCCREK